MKSRFASCTRLSLEGPWASQEHLRRASMIAARSTLLGQRVEQVSHEAQYQMERPASTRSYWPSCRSRTIRFGGCSIKLRIGHPAEHLPHWKQRLTELPESASTFRTNPRFMVSVESCILACFTASPFLPGAGIPCRRQENDAIKIKHARIRPCRLTPT